MQNQLDIHKVHKNLRSMNINANVIDSQQEIGYNINQNLGAMHYISEWVGGWLWKTISEETVIWSG